ncbi:hypothetical protein [Nostoc sp. UHCC 0252]|uniref:hypothetical protein n=1 Tax=Nostoc sp. UHCC 0252 TaxID=3110241 RepID=UPI002B20F1DF|nr:hypothetical protein [Nostoc sp. UHCC 0252]MEA5605664.1 hypothetical protein [Nostoc sp. UHCC 0252]
MKVSLHTAPQWFGACYAYLITHLSKTFSSLLVGLGLALLQPDFVPGLPSLAVFVSWQCLINQHDGLLTISCNSVVIQDMEQPNLEVLSIKLPSQQ